MAGRLSDKVVVVAGAGAAGPGWGIGKACAVLYAREGAHVFAIDMDRAAVVDTARLIQEEGGNVTAGIGDLTREDDVTRLTEEAVRTYGRIDVLHNNIASTRIGGPASLSISDWNDSWRINVTSMFLACKAVLPRMERQGHGTIVNTASIAASLYLGTPYTAYYATKAAVLQFTRAVAIEYAQRNVRANAVSPGFIDTAQTRAVRQARGHVATHAHDRAAQTPMRREGTPLEVAYAALFLASDESSYITGAEIVVDGGVSAAAVS
jgi:NAD(P)-dependent dehydrogenase (short-subunit alcohol dehydrogenase family)